MSKTDRHGKEFLKIFDGLAIRHNRWEVWQDFVYLSALSISNAVDKRNAAKREETYRHIAAKYSSAELEQITALFGETAEGLKENPEQDFLGSMYMMCGMGSDHAGQFFTPYHISAMLAGLADEIDPDREPGGFMTLSEPSCGAGANIIAFANACRQRKIDYSSKVLVIAQDIDSVVGLMCYIQISLLGCAGYVVIGDTLSRTARQADRWGLIPKGPQERIWYTTEYASEIWAARRKIAEMEVFQTQWKTKDWPKACRTGS